MNVNSATFTDKKIGERSLFLKIHGLSQACQVGENEVVFTVPYEHCKITGIHVVNCKVLDTVSCYVLLANDYVAGQFGVEVIMPEGLYQSQSNYDADLYLGMKIKFSYTAQEARSIGFNLILHEVR